MAEQAETRVFELSADQLAREGFRLDLLQELFVRGVIDETTRLKLELALQEAVTNSFEHGNLELVSAWKEEFDSEGVDRYSSVKRERLLDVQYARRRVYVNAQYLPGQLTISVRDEGHGFIPEPSPLSKELLSHGRGLHMISSSVDEVQFNDGGREIVLVKKIPL